MEALKVIPKSTLIYRRETSDVVFTTTSTGTPGLLVPEASPGPLGLSSWRETRTLTSYLIPKKQRTKGPFLAAFSWDRRVSYLEPFLSRLFFVGAISGVRGKRGLRFVIFRGARHCITQLIVYCIPITHGSASFRWSRLKANSFSF